MDYVYNVIGTEGEYSDRACWIVATYTTEEQAQEHMNALRLYFDTFPPSPDYTNEHVWQSAEWKARRDLISAKCTERRKKITELVRNNPYDSYGSAESIVGYKILRSLYVRHLDEFYENFEGQQSDSI